MALPPVRCGIDRFAAGTRPVAVAGGPAMVGQYLAAGLIAELSLHVAPVTLSTANGSSTASASGSGERRCSWTDARGTRYPAAPPRGSLGHQARVSRLRGLGGAAAGHC